MFFSFSRINIGAIALSYPPHPPPIVIDDSSLKKAAESFAVALTLTLGGYESAIAPRWLRKCNSAEINCSLWISKGVNSK